MNLQLHIHSDRNKLCMLSNGAVNLLVLVSEWLQCAGDVTKVDVILVILDGISVVSELKSCSVLWIQQYLERLDRQLQKSFENCVKSTSKDLLQFLHLFEQLSKAINQKLNIDKDIKNSVISVFIRRCVLEYQRLTFAQVCRLHSIWAFSTFADEAVDLITVKPCKHNNRDLPTCLHEAMVKEAGGLMSVNCMNSLEKPLAKQVEAEALQVAQLHGKFTHTVEGLFALQESIRIGQQRNNQVLLEHALGWLHKLQPVEMDNALRNLARFIKNAEDLNLPTLGMWGRLQEAGILLKNGQQPKKVMEVLLSSETGFSSVYTTKVQKISQRSSLLSTLRVALYQYGHRVAAVFYSELLCQSDVHKTDVEENESFVLSICSLAKYMFKNGLYDKSIDLLRVTKDRLNLHGPPFKTLCACTEEVCFDRAIQLNDLAKAKFHLYTLSTFNKDSAKYRSAVLAKHEGKLDEALEKTSGIAQMLVKVNDVTTICDCWLLLADTLASMQSPSIALPHVVSCLSFCRERYFTSLVAVLHLAHLHLQLGCPSKCIDLVEAYLLDAWSQGLAHNIARMYFLKAQAVVMRKEIFTSEDKWKQQVLMLLNASADFYNTCTLSSSARCLEVMQANSTI